VSHKDAPPATAVQIAVEAFYTNLLKPQGVTVGWGRDKHGKFLASYARDAQAAWEAAQALHSTGDDARDAEMGRAIKHAAEHLPENYSIQIGIERGSAWIDLISPEGTIDVEHNDDGLAYEMADAVRKAQEDAALEAAIAREKLE
jgi:hypothetical protein